MLVLATLCTLLWKSWFSAKFFVRSQFSRWRNNFRASPPSICSFFLLIKLKLCSHFQSGRCWLVLVTLCVAQLDKGEDLISYGLRERFSLSIRLDEKGSKYPGCHWQLFMTRRKTSLRSKSIHSVRQSWKVERKKKNKLGSWLHHWVA